MSVECDRRIFATVQVPVLVSLERRITLDDLTGGMENMKGGAKQGEKDEKGKPNIATEVIWP